VNIKTTITTTTIMAYLKNIRKAGLKKIRNKRIRK
jgi:hypothetical protein